MRITLDHLRRYAVARSLFKPTTLGRAISKLGFVQADPIRAPARAQALTLRHRVVDYTAGDLERLLTSRQLTGQFPNYEAVLPRETTKSVTVHGADLNTAIQRVAQFADERSRAIRMKRSG